jgi:RNA polymerase sigma factor (sigma-70 family)
MALGEAMSDGSLELDRLQPMMADGPADSLAVGLADGSPAGGRKLADLYESYCAELCNYLKRTFGAGPPDAQDVVHEAFAKFAALRERTSVHNPRAYLYRSSYHIYIDERRRLSNWRNGVAPALADAGSQNDEITPERVFIANERLESLRHAIQSLPVERRRSFLLHRLYGLSCAEIARRDGYSESAIKKHIALAMADIDAALTKQDAGRTGG